MNIEKNESLNEMRNSYHASQNIDIKNISIEKESIIQEAATKAQKNQIEPIISHDINNVKKNLIKANNEKMNNINDYLSQKEDKPINNNTSKNNTDSDKYYKRKINEEISQKNKFPLIIQDNKKLSENLKENTNILNPFNGNNHINTNAQLYTKSLNSKSKQFYHKVFNKLISTKEESLLLNSSYENINNISKNKYINDKSLQNKIKNFIIDECLNNVLSLKKFEIKKDYVSPFASIQLPKIEINYYDKQSHNNISSIANFKKEKFLYKINSSVNLTKRSFQKSNKHSELGMPLANETEKILPMNNISKKMHKRNSTNNISSLKMSNIYSPSRIKRKINKQSCSIGKKLCAINKNILNANEAINQPGKFYKSLFNNILQKEPNLNKGTKKKKAQGKLIGFSDALGICKKNSINSD